MVELLDRGAPPVRIAPGPLEVIEQPDECTIYNEAYITERSAKRHYMRIFRGYPFSTYILMLLKTNGVKIVRIKEVDRDDGKEVIYETFLSDF